MVNVTLYNLLRSKYRIHEVSVPPGTIHEIIQSIRKQHPQIKESELLSAVVFYQGTPIHATRFDTNIPDNENIIMTHFVGGG